MDINEHKRALESIGFVCKAIDDEMIQCETNSSYFGLKIEGEEGNRQLQYRSKYEKRPVSKFIDCNECNYIGGDFNNAVEFYNNKDLFNASILNNNGISVVISGFNGEIIALERDEKW